jgi:hypothetical protein
MDAPAFYRAGHDAPCVSAAKRSTLNVGLFDVRACANTPDKNETPGACWTLRAFFFSTDYDTAKRIDFQHGLPAMRRHAIDRDGLRAHPQSANRLRRIHRRRLRRDSSVNTLTVIARGRLRIHATSSECNHAAVPRSVNFTDSGNFPERISRQRCVRP